MAFMRYSRLKLRNMSIAELETLQKQQLIELRKVEQTLDELKDAGWDIEHSGEPEKIDEAKAAIDTADNYKEDLIMRILQAEQVIAKGYDAIDTQKANLVTIQKWKDKGFTSIHPGNFYQFMKVLDFLGRLNYDYELEDVDEAWTESGGDYQGTLEILSEVLGL